MRTIALSLVLTACAAASAEPTVGSGSVAGLWELDLVALRTSELHAATLQNERASALIEQSAGAVWEFVDDDTFRIHFGQTAELPMRLEPIDDNSASFSFGPGIEAGRSLTLTRTGPNAMLVENTLGEGDGAVRASLPYIRRIDPKDAASEERRAQLAASLVGEWRVDRDRFDDPAVAPLVHEAVRFAGEDDLARFSIEVDETGFGFARRPYEIIAAGQSTLALRVGGEGAWAIHFIEFLTPDSVNMFTGRHALPLTRREQPE